MTGKKIYIHTYLHTYLYIYISTIIDSYCSSLKAIRYESMSLNRIAADKSHRVIVALVIRTLTVTVDV